MEEQSVRDTEVPGELGFSRTKTPSDFAARVVMREPQAIHLLGIAGNTMEDTQMADDGGGQSFLGFILGGVVVVVALIGFFVYSGGHMGGGKTAVIAVPTTTGSSK